ncbi:MAG TPA: MFS transporter [Thermodesulfovibrionia bacterium]|nr:MFS transporter [Thermodesulfovibrionia bacterium]
MKNPKQILSWCFFDFANSSYSAVISAVVFPVYYVSAIVGNETGMGDLWWGRAISASMAFVAVTSLFLGGIADYSGRRKKLLLFYTLLCVLSVTSFSLLKKGMIIEGFFLVMLANIGMEGGLVFYNSFLPEIAEKEYQGRVSAWGYAIGYAGSILSLLIALPLVKSGHYNETWFMVAVFFAVFSLPAFFFLPPDRKTGQTLLRSAGRGGKYSWKTLKEMWKHKELRKFLLSFLIYEDGVNTVIVFSSIFAATTLGFDAKELIGLYLIVQITALVGAFIMAKPIDLWGPKKIVTLSLLMWSFVAVSAYFISLKSHFFILASFAGLGLGTVQAASRAFFAQFIPIEHESEYFGAYSLVGKSSAVAGPIVFGYISSAVGSQRPAILAVSVFFIIGLVLVQYVEGGGPNIEQSDKPMHDS